MPNVLRFPGPAPDAVEEPGQRAAAVAELMGAPAELVGRMLAAVREVAATGAAEPREVIQPPRPRLL